jgi:hypothetical protein
LFGRVGVPKNSHDQDAVRDPLPDPTEPVNEPRGRSRGRAAGNEPRTGQQAEQPIYRQARTVARNPALISITEAVRQAYQQHPDDPSA